MILTEDQVVKSKIFKAVLEQAKALSEEASQCDELRSKLQDCHSKIQSLQRDRSEVQQQFKTTLDELKFENSRITA